MCTQYILKSEGRVFLFIMVFYAYGGFRRRKRWVQFTIKYVVCTYVGTRAPTFTRPCMPRHLDATGTRAQLFRLAVNWFYFVWNRVTARCDGLNLETTPPKIPLSQSLNIERIRIHNYEWKRQRYVVYQYAHCLEQWSLDAPLVRSRSDVHGTSTKQCYHLAINRHIKS